MAIERATVSQMVDASIGAQFQEQALETCPLWEMAFDLRPWCWHLVEDLPEAGLVWHFQRLQIEALSYMASVIDSMGSICPTVAGALFGTFSGLLAFWHGEYFLQRILFKFSRGRIVKKSIHLNSGS